MIDCMQDLMGGDGGVVIFIGSVGTIMMTVMVMGACVQRQFANVIDFMRKPRTAVTPCTEVRQKNDEHQEGGAANKERGHGRDFTMPRGHPPVHASAEIYVAMCTDPDGACTRVGVRTLWWHLVDAGRVLWRRSGRNRHHRHERQDECDSEWDCRHGVANVVNHVRQKRDAARNQDDGELQAGCNHQNRE